MIRTQIQLTEEQYAALKQLASQKNLSMSELIRKAVDMLIKSSIEVTSDERKNRAISAAGKFSSNLKDLSVNHDNYLAEAYEK